MKDKTRKTDKLTKIHLRLNTKRKKLKVRFSLLKVKKTQSVIGNQSNLTTSKKSKRKNRSKLNPNSSLFCLPRLLSTIRNEFDFVIKRIALCDSQVQQRQRTLNRLGDFFKGLNLEMCVYGSFYTRLSLPSSDLDVTVYPITITNTNTDKLLSLISFQLRNRNMLKPGSLRIIRFARVPLIKFIDNESDLNIDISVSQDSGIEGTNLVEGILREYPHLTDVILFLKLLLRQYGLNDASVGGVSSFLLFHMVYCFYKMKYFNGEIFERASFLIGFFQFYSEFDYRLFGIRTYNIESRDYPIGTNAYFIKRERFPNSPEENLSIENFLQPSQDVGTASREFYNVKRLFGLCIQKFHSYASFQLDGGLFLNSSNSIIKYDKDLTLKKFE